MSAHCKWSLILSMFKGNITQSVAHWIEQSSWLWKVTDQAEIIPDKVQILASAANLIAAEASNQFCFANICYKKMSSRILYSYLGNQAFTI